MCPQRGATVAQCWERPVRGREFNSHKKTLTLNIRKLRRIECQNRNTRISMIYWKIACGLQICICATRLHQKRVALFNFHRPSKLLFLLFRSLSFYDESPRYVDVYLMLNPLRYAFRSNGMEIGNKRPRGWMRGILTLVLVSITIQP